MLTPRIFLLPIFLFTFVVNGFSKSHTNILALFYSLPDSIFTKNNYCFDAEKDSFSLRERKVMSFGYSDSVYNLEPDARHLIFLEVSDSIGKLTFGNGLDSPSTTLSILETKGNEVFFSVESSRCDFVACFQLWNFYSKKGKKIKEVQDVLPGYYPASFFFKKPYLDSVKVDPGSDIPGIELTFTNDPHFLKISVNTEFFDPELVTVDSSLLVLDLGRLSDDDLFLVLTKRKFIISHLILPTEISQPAEN
jgi:hypothetical protein